MELKQIRELVEAELKTDISTKSRRREIVYARDLYFKLARDYTNSSYSQIGKEVSRDHATAMHGYKTCTDVILKYDIKFIKSYGKLTRILNRITNDPLKYIQPDSYYREKYKDLMLDHRLLIHKFREVHSQLSKMKGLEVHRE